MFSFDNPANAFKARSNSALNRSFWLFKLIGSPWVVKMASAVSPLSLKLSFKPLIKATIFKLFVGGEDINNRTCVINEFGNYNIGTILDYSGEGKASQK